MQAPPLRSVGTVLPALPWLLLCGCSQGENFGLLILVDLGAPELSLGSVPKMIWTAPGVWFVKLRLTIAIPLSQVPMAFLVTAACRYRSTGRAGAQFLHSNPQRCWFLHPHLRAVWQPCGSCWSMTRGVEYLESCQLIVKRLRSEILLKVLMFGQIQLKQKPGLIWGSVPCSKSSPRFKFSRSLLDALNFFSEKQLAKTLTLMIRILLSSRSWRAQRYFFGKFSPSSTPSHHH